MSFRFPPVPAIGVSALSAVMVVACGSVSEAPTPLSSQSAAYYSANGSVVGAQATSALDATLLTAIQLVPGTAKKLAAGRDPAVTTSSGRLNCAGGGTATMTIKGASAVEENNGRFDANEVYQLAFIDCRGAAGQAVLNGAVTMNVVSATRGATAVSLSTTTLRAASTRGVVSFIGSADLQRAVVNSGSGSKVTTRVLASGLDITADSNGGTGNFTLSNIDLTREAKYFGGVLLSTSYGGSHGLAGEFAGQAFDYNVATQDGATFDANGVPTQGTWLVTLRSQTVLVTVADGSMRVEIDEAKDGTIDRSFSMPLGLFGADAG